MTLGLNAEVAEIAETIMLAGYGWCVLRSSREAYKRVDYESDDWSDAVEKIDRSVFQSDRQLHDRFVSWMTSANIDLMHWHLEDALNFQDGRTLLFQVHRNHRPHLVWDMLEWIAKNGSASYGLFYVHDDEDDIGPKRYGRGENNYTNVFRVHRIANGAVTELDDPFLSPIVPFLNPT